METRRACEHRLACEKNDHGECRELGDASHTCRSIIALLAVEIGDTDHVKSRHTRFNLLCF